MLTREMAHEILDVAMDINVGLERRCGKGHPTAFFSYNGHVNTICVDVYIDGWYKDTPEEPTRIYFEDYYEEEHLEKELERLKGIKTLIKAARFRDRFKRKPAGVRNDIL